MSQDITYIGLDVHKDSIRGAVLPPGFEACQEERTHASDLPRLAKWLKRMERKWGTVTVCYEASGAGYVLHRDLTRRGISCEVVAPSLIPKRAGDRRKTDKRDARQLAVLYRAGALTMVHVPDREDEAVRSLVRLRRALQKDTLRARHQVLKHLQRNGEVYRAGNHWTKRHWTWLERVKLPLSHEQFVLRKFLEKLEYLVSQLAEVDDRIREEAFSGEFADRAARLMCLRGISTTSAMILATEISDFTRFPEATKLMDYVGLTPSEHSSGPTVRRGGITKAGSSYCRHALIQASWAIVRTRPQTGPRLREAWKGQPPWVIALAQKAMKRLHKRYWHLVHRGKTPQVAITAVARELAGFVWAAMQEDSSVAGEVAA